MNISENTLHKLIEEYSAPREEFGGNSYITRRRDWFDKPMEQIRPLLDKKHLRVLTLEEAGRIYNEMAVGGPRLYPKTYIENGLEKIKASLEYLLYGTDALDVRFTNFTGNPESEFRLNGVGRAFASTALFLVDFQNYGIWNSAVDGGLRVLDMLPPKKRLLGETYVQIVNILKQLQATCGFDDLSVTDEFVELIYHEKIGVGVFKAPEKQVEKAAEVEEASEEKAAFYSRQLSAYAYALENPAPNALGLSPISRMGLFVVTPDRFERTPAGEMIFINRTTWMDVPRDDKAFLAFLSDVVAVLDIPTPPNPSETCGLCSYRNTMQDLSL